MNTISKKKRLDVALQEQHPNYSRTQINSWIMQGKASVNDIVVTKAGTAVNDQDSLLLSVEEPRYVCRGGFKLEKALEHFNITVTGLTALDAGLSTGGFTDCLIQHGANKVYGIDVGYGQVHEKIRNNPQVVVMEKTNLRYATYPDIIPEQVDIVTLDLSFISLNKVIPAVTTFLVSGGKLITLIKPQFEAEKHEIGPKGIIKDPTVHARVIEKVTKEITEHGFTLQGSIESPLKGTMGNTEFLAYFIHTGK